MAYLHQCFPASAHTANLQRCELLELANFVMRLHFNAAFQALTLRARLPTPLTSTSNNNQQGRVDLSAGVPDSQHAPALSTTPVLQQAAPPPALAFVLSLVRQGPRCTSQAGPT